MNVNLTCNAFLQVCLITTTGQCIAVRPGAEAVFASVQARDPRIRSKRFVTAQWFKKNKCITTP